MKRTNLNKKTSVEPTYDGFLVPQQPKKLPRNAGKIHQPTSQSDTLPNGTTSDFNSIASSLQNINKLVNDQLKTLLTSASANTSLDNKLSFLLDKNNVRSLSFMHDEVSAKTCRELLEKSTHKNKLVEQRNDSLSLLGRKTKRHFYSDNNRPDNGRTGVKEKTFKIPGHLGAKVRNISQECISPLPMDLECERPSHKLCNEITKKNTDINNINEKNEILKCINDNCEKLSDEASITDNSKPYEEETCLRNDCGIDETNVIVNLQTNIFNITKVQKKVNPSANNCAAEFSLGNNVEVTIFNFRAILIIALVLALPVIATVMSNHWIL
jgi:hypothetical protein